MELWELQGACKLPMTGLHLHKHIEWITNEEDISWLQKMKKTLKRKVAEAEKILEHVQELLKTAVTQTCPMPGMVECAAVLVTCTEGFISMHMEILQLLSWTPLKCDDMGLVKAYWTTHDAGLLYWQWDLVEEPMPLI